MLLLKIVVSQKILNIQIKYSITCVELCDNTYCTARILFIFYERRWSYLVSREQEKQLSLAAEMLLARNSHLPFKLPAERVITRVNRAADGAAICIKAGEVAAEADAVTVSRENESDK